MTKRTLLDLTQSILSSLDSDEVNSISDTPESRQVAEIIKNVYLNMMVRSGLPEHKQLFQLEPSTDQDSPVLMYRPDTANTIEWIKYYTVNTDNVQSTGFIHDLNTDITTHGANTPSPPAFRYVTILPVQQFLDIVNGYNIDSTEVETFDFQNFQFRFKNDSTPTFCTILQDLYVIFDSYDKLADTTLQGSKTMCFGSVLPDFQMVDSFTPPIDEPQFPLLYNEAKSLAFLELKQTVHMKAEQEIKRQWSSIQKNKSVSDKPSYFNQFAYYGRK